MKKTKQNNEIESDGVFVMGRSGTISGWEKTAQRDDIQAETEMRKRQARKDFMGHQIYRQEGCGGRAD